MHNLIINIRSKKKEYNDQIKAHLTAMSKECPNEPGCVMWHAYQNEEDSNNFFIIESWDSKDLWKNHMTQNAFITNYENGLLKLIERDIYEINKI